MVYYKIDRNDNRVLLDQSIVDAIWYGAMTKQNSDTAYDVEEIIVECDGFGGNNLLWAYRAGGIWVTVPAAFEGMTFRWADYPEDVQHLREDG